MKNIFKIILLITSFPLGLIGCNNDDDVSYESNSLHGTWNLTSYGGGFTGQYENYKKRAVIWNFDTINNVVLIKSKLDYFGPNSGNYPYEIRQDDKNKVLFLNDSVQGIFYLNDKEFVFTQALTATFRR